MFLRDLQVLHDFESHWDDKGLTENGKNHVKTVKERILAGVYK